MRSSSLAHSVCLAATLLSPAALAQPFSVDWHTIEPGGASQGDAFALDCVIGQPDAGPTMSGGVFSLTGGFLTGIATPPHCPADLDNGSGLGTPDGGVTIEDLLFFLNEFELGSGRADLDDGSGTGTPDGGVTIEDLLYFLFHFEGGC